jgi:hypothetical protein
MKTLFLLFSFLLLSVTTISAQWTSYPTGVPYSLFAVDFYDDGITGGPDELIGVAVGQGGTVLRTADGGHTWTLVSQNLNHEIWLNDVKFVTADVVYAAGMGGVIIRSADAGISWTEVRHYDDPIHTIRGIDFYPGKITFVGYAGTYFETAGGPSPVFNERTEIPWTMHSIAFSPDFATNGIGIIVGTDGLAWNTENGGVNWVSRNSGRYDYLNDVVFISPTTAYLCGNNGLMMYTVDGGRTWAVRLPFLTTKHLRSIDRSNFAGGPPWNITAVGDNGTILTTATGGGTWTNVSLVTETRHFYGICLNGTHLGTCVGEVGTGQLNEGMMYNIFDNGTIGVNQIGTTVPQKFALNQNFPNPFNPTTKISFSMAKAGPVMLTVFDMSGKEVTKLVNTTLSAGNFEYEFDGSKLSSGVYFYRIITNDFVDTKKMSLLK